MPHSAAFHLGLHCLQKYSIRGFWSGKGFLVWKGLAFFLFNFSAHIAFCGEIFDLSIQLPYTDFLPLTNSISFIFKVRSLFQPSNVN